MRKNDNAMGQDATGENGPHDNGSQDSVQTARRWQKNDERGSSGTHAGGTTLVRRRVRAYDLLIAELARLCVGLGLQPHLLLGTGFVL